MAGIIRHKHDSLRREPDAIADAFPRQFDVKGCLSVRRYFADRLLSGKIDGINISLRITGRTFDTGGERAFLRQRSGDKECFICGANTQFGGQKNSKGNGKASQCHVGRMAETGDRWKCKAEGQTEGPDSEPLGAKREHQPLRETAWLEGLDAHVRSIVGDRQECLVEPSLQGALAEQPLWRDRDACVGRGARDASRQVAHTVDSVDRGRHARDAIERGEHAEARAAPPTDHAGVPRNLAQVPGPQGDRLCQAVQVVLADAQVHAVVTDVGGAPRHARGLARPCPARDQDAGAFVRESRRVNRKDPFRPHDQVDQRQEERHSSKLRAALHRPASSGCVEAETGSRPGSGICSEEEEPLVGEPDLVRLDPLHRATRPNFVDEANREVRLTRERTVRSDLRRDARDVSRRRIDQPDSYKTVDVVVHNRR